MGGTVQEQIQWLVRKNSPHQAPDPVHGHAPSGITVLGPFVTEQIRSMIDQGMLEADDEICPENSYWFGLHEVIEVKRFLGIDNFAVPLRLAGTDETTQPDLETTRPDLESSDDDKTPPGLMPEHLQNNSTNNPDATGIITIKRPVAPPPSALKATPAAKSGKPAAAKPAPPRPATAKDLSDKFKRVAPAPLAYSNPETDAVDRSGWFGMEKSQLLAIVIIAAVIMAVLAVVWVIKSLRV